MKSVIEIRHYITRVGKDVFDDWLSDLADARQAPTSGIVRAADRLGTWLSGLLRDGRQGLRIASLRRRQTKTVVRYRSGTKVPQGLQGKDRNP